MRIAAAAILSLLALHASEAGVKHWDQESLNKSLRHEAMSGVIPKIEQLIRSGAEINSKAPHGETALEYAIRFHRYGAALRLIELGADPNAADDDGMTPLMRAAGAPNASRVVDALLQAGADVNRRDLYGRTALMFAAQGDCIHTIAILLTRARTPVEIDAESDAFQSAYSLAREGLIVQMLGAAREAQRIQSDGESGTRKRLN